MRTVSDFPLFFWANFWSIKRPIHPSFLQITAQVNRVEINTVQILINPKFFAKIHGLVVSSSSVIRKLLEAKCVFYGHVEITIHQLLSRVLLLLNPRVISAIKVGYDGWFGLCTTPSDLNREWADAFRPNFLYTFRWILSFWSPLLYHKICLHHPLLE
jgi:hypothetical protein